uniref:Uncharacterized protein n=1 Tax=Noccaea caerulescens TaxID=107243 RepID=A0A1J3JL00_NOCCA
MGRSLLSSDPWPPQCSRNSLQETISRNVWSYASITHEKYLSLSTYTPKINFSGIAFKLFTSRSDQNNTNRSDLISFIMMRDTISESQILHNLKTWFSSPTTTIGYHMK